MKKRLALFGVSLAALGAVAFAPDANARIQEDDPGWDCVSMGDRSCGPTNTQGVTAGCYDDGGVLVAPWPCHIVVNPDGSSDVYAYTN